MSTNPYCCRQGSQTCRLASIGRADLVRERKMHTNFFCTNFLSTPRGPGHAGKIPGTSQTPLLETQGRQTFEGGHELFGHHPFAWKTPTLAIPLACYRIGFGPPARNRKKIGKYRFRPPKALPLKIGKNSRKIGKIGEK